MSRRVEIKGQIQDMEALKNAIEGRLGGTMFENTPARVRGVDCEHYATFPNQFYNLGVKDKDSEYDLVFDDMLTTVGKGAGKLLDAYNCEKTILEANYKGYTYSEFTEQDGTQVVEVYLSDF